MTDPTRTARLLEARLAELARVHDERGLHFASMATAEALRLGLLSREHARAIWAGYGANRVRSRTLNTPVS